MVNQPEKIQATCLEVRLEQIILVLLYKDLMMVEIKQLKAKQDQLDKLTQGVVYLDLKVRTILQEQETLFSIVRLSNRTQCFKARQRLRQTNLLPICLADQL